MTDLYFEICRGKTHIFCETKDTNTVSDLKGIVGDILKVKPDDQRLHDGKKQLLVESKKLAECGFDEKTANVLQPAVVYLSMKKKDGNFEEISVEPLSIPPPLDELLRHSEEKQKEKEKENKSGSGDDKKVN